MDIHQERLIRRAASGDDSAFEQLMLAQQKQVYNLCLRMSGNPEDAFDLSQEAFLRAWRALAQYQFEAEFSTWLFRLTRNVCIDFLRKQKRQPTVPLETEQDGETAGAGAAAAGQRTRAGGTGAARRKAARAGGGHAGPSGGAAGNSDPAGGQRPAV